MIIAIPTGVKVFNWLFTMYKGRIILSTPMLWVIAFFTTFAIGGMTGVSRDVIPYGLSFGNRNYLGGINLIGLRRRNVSNKEILTLTEAYKEIFKTEHLHDNLTKLNGEFKDNNYVKEVVDFINKDKKRPICTPFSK